MTQIVTVNVSTQVAPTPPSLQSTGALISQGGTTTAPGTSTFLTQPADLTTVLKGSLALTSLVWAANVVTATTVVPHGFTVADTLLITISGETPAGYNGTFLATVTGASTFTYPLGVNPGAQTIAGSYTPEDVAELNQMVTTFFAQGQTQGVYVLELGPGNAVDGIAFLTAWIAANQNVYYSYLVPRTWDGVASFLTLIGTLESSTAKTYFFVTTTLATYKSYTLVMKDVLTMIEAPAYGTWPADAVTVASWSAGIATLTTDSTNHGVLPGQWFTITGVTPIGYNGTWQALSGTTGSTLVYANPTTLGAGTLFGTLVASLYASAGIGASEFSMASLFRDTLSQAPSSTNRVTPTNFDFLFGVTPFPTQGNGALLTTLKNAFVNVVGTGAEGGISNTLVIPGTTMDGNDFTYWYSIDWVQLNIDLNISNAIINGSNNPVNPLNYNQDGVNRLQAVANSTMSSGVQFGLVLGQPVQTTYPSGGALNNAIATGQYNNLTVVNAVPFVPYSIANPGDYKIGKYGGFTIVYVPARGFASVVFNVIVTQFVAQ
jgi:hypothetical protein